MRSSPWVLSLVTFATQAIAATADRGGNVFVLEFGDAPPAEPFAAVEEGLLNAGLACTIIPRHTFDTTLFAGVSMLADCTGQDPRLSVLDTINDLEFVKKAWPASRTKSSTQPNPQPADVQRRQAPPTTLPKRQSPLNDTGLFELSTLPTHADTGIPALHAQNITGAGVRIAVIDSGFDLAAPGLSQTHITYNFNYAHSASNFSSNETCIPFLHGTHVLGIIAADSPEQRFGIVGVAPGATMELHGLEACDGSDSGSLDDLMAAIVAASGRGVDLIMVGYGIPLAFQEEPVASLVSRVVANGTAVTVGSGNSGPGPFTGGSPASGLGVAAVGSSDNSATPYYTWRLNYTASSGESGFLRFTPSFPSDFPPGNNLTLWMPGSSVGLPAGCNPAPADFVPPADPANTIMLIEEEHCWLDPRNTSSRLALSLGVPYVLRHQPARTTVADGMQWVPGFAEFSRSYSGIARLSNPDGNFLASLLAKGEVTVAVPGSLADDAHEEVLYRANDLSGGLVSSFSSWGPTPEGRSYPSFVAPGENILSTFLPRYGGVAVVGGTSMANPFAVGVYALVKQRHPEYTPADLLSVVASTAKPLQFVDASRRKFEYLAPVFSQGGGLVDAYAAVNTVSLVNVSSLDFNDTAHRPSVLSFGLKNAGNESISYTLGHLGAASGYILSESNSYTLAGADTHPIYADVEITPSTITLPPGASTEVSVSITSSPVLPDADRRGVYFGGYITITPSGPSAINLTLPYTGFATPLAAIPMINPTASHLVAVDPATNVDTRVEPGSVFTCLYNASIPLPGWPVDCDPGWPGFKRVFLTQSRNYTYDLVDAGTGDTILPSTFASSEGEYFSPSTWWVWNGSEEGRKFVPPGSYFWRLRALRLNGDAGREGHWDTWESGNWTLAYSPDSIGLPDGMA